MQKGGGDPAPDAMLPRSTGNGSAGAAGLLRVGLPSTLNSDCGRTYESYLTPRL